MVFFKLFIIALVLLGIALLGMAVRLLFVRNGKFVNTHIENNVNFQKLGIHCASHEDSTCGGNDFSDACSSCCGKLV